MAANIAKNQPSVIQMFNETCKDKTRSYDMLIRHNIWGQIDLYPLQEMDAKAKMQKTSIFKCYPALKSVA